jgi:hypothetical protein
MDVTIRIFKRCKIPLSSKQNNNNNNNSWEGKEEEIKIIK